MCIRGRIGFIGCEVAEKDPNYDEHNTPTRRYVDYDHTTQTGKIIKYYASRTVPYTHLTLPTIHSVKIPGVAASLKKKK